MRNVKYENTQSYLPSIIEINSPSHLKMLFKARIGTTMSAWRSDANRLT